LTGGGRASRLGEVIQTVHRLLLADSRDLSEIPRESVDLVVTSPPYPMIRMWDPLFARLNPEVGSALDRQDGPVAFELMHAELEKVWAQLWRVLKPGAWACLNVGDATRRIGRSFRLYANQARIAQSFQRQGFQSFPMILWRKQTNAPNKFLGSGMLPAGAYVTLEHEYILIFRKGDRRQFEAGEQVENRRRSALFWEERNRWFSDLWDFKGVRQSLDGSGARQRSAAFPFELAYRLVHMYSVRGDRVLDPFLGTGTTMFAAMAACRDSIGVEIDAELYALVERECEGLPPLARERVCRRLEEHREFMAGYQGAKGGARHCNRRYGVPVVTSQETDLLLDLVQSVRREAAGQYRVLYEEAPASAAPEAAQA
jgi:DNA modification methylase